MGFLERESEKIPDQPGDKYFAWLERDISFEKVNFRYPNSDRYVLQQSYVFNSDWPYSSGSG